VLHQVNFRNTPQRGPQRTQNVALLSNVDSISRPGLWLLLSRLGIPGKIINLMKSLYDQSASCVRANGLQSEWFEITSSVRQGCVIAPDSFATGVEWVMDRATGMGMNGVVLGQDAYTDLDFADDIALLAELLSLLFPVLEAFADEAAAIGLEVNWDKTKVQALGSQQPDVETLDVHGHQVAVVDEFVYLGALTFSGLCGPLVWEHVDRS